jgi:hypothetical protein
VRRSFTCTVTLGFVHPISGEEMQFVMPLPEDLQEFIERLRLSGK